MRRAVTFLLSGICGLLAVAAVATAALGPRHLDPAPAAEAQAAKPTGAMRVASSSGASAVLAGPPLAPGQSLSGRTSIANTGRGEGELTVSAANLRSLPGPGGAALAGVLELVVLDVTGGADAVLYAGPLGSMRPVPLARLRPKERRRYEFRATLPADAEPSLAGAGVSLDFSWGLKAARKAKPCRYRLTGTAARNRVIGTRGGDRINGGAGDDLLKGGEGADCIVGGPGRDRIMAGGGADRVMARDGLRDRVDCGPGVDRATVDRADRVAGCERVSRR